MTHYERQNVEALGKLRVLEPQLTRNENELEKLQKEVKKVHFYYLCEKLQIFSQVEKKNRALMETQRHFELNRKDLKAELQVRLLTFFSKNRF